MKLSGAILCLMMMVVRRMITISMMLLAMMMMYLHPFAPHAGTTLSSALRLETQGLSAVAA